MSNHVSNFKRKVFESNFKLKIMRKNLRLKFDSRFVVKTFHLKFDTMCWKSANEIKQPNKAWMSNYNHDNIFDSWQHRSSQKIVGIIFGPPGFFCEFQQISEVKCVLNKRTIKVCVSCFWWCPGPSAPSGAHLTVSLIFLRFQKQCTRQVAGSRRALFQLKKPFKGQRWRWGSCC